MDLADRIAALIERRRYVVTEAVRLAIDDLIAEVEDATGRQSRFGDEEDEGEQDDDLAPTRMIDCPHCGERQPILLDFSQGDQDGIRDCAVCCRPIRIRYQLDDGRVTDFRADPG